MSDAALCHKIVKFGRVLCIHECAVSGVSIAPDAEQVKAYTIVLRLSDFRCSMFSGYGKLLR